MVGGGLQQAAPEILIHPGVGDGGGPEMGADKFFVVADEAIDFLLGEDALLHQQALEGQNPLLEGWQRFFAGFIARFDHGRSAQSLQFSPYPRGLGLGGWGLVASTLGQLAGFHLGQGSGRTSRKGGKASITQEGATRPTGPTVIGGWRLILGTLRGAIGRSGHGRNSEKEVKWGEI